MSYTSVKAFIDQFREEFDYKKVAKTRLKDSGERATKQAIDDEIEILKEEYQKASQRGTDIHKKHQNKIIKSKECVVGVYENNGKKSKSIITDEENVLKNNTTYIEKKVIYDKYKLIGYSDQVDVIKNFINVEEVKTFKKLYRTSSIKLKSGLTLAPKYFFSPIDKLQDCNYYQTALQSSIYMYILWIHNKHLKPGKIHLRHIKTNDKDDIIEEELIELPYLLDEVKKILKYRLKNGFC